MNPGELIFFPPGLIHTTRVESDECSTSLSLQFAFPNPVGYIKEFHNFLISDVIGASKCFLDHFNAWLFGEQIPTQDASAEANRRFCDQEFARIDADGSGVITREEAEKHLSGLRTRMIDGSGGGLVEDDLGLESDSFMEAHDSSRDGIVSKAEFDAVVFALWTPRMAQVSRMWARPRPITYFFRADVNNDEYVTQEELAETYPDADWEQMLLNDDDGDGRIFQGEFHVRGVFVIQVYFLFLTHHCGLLFFGYFLFG